MPDNATTLASTPNCFMATKQIKTASGRTADISIELAKCITLMRTTMTVTKISSDRALFRVPRVS